MENLPVEIIGNILSCLKAARDIVIVSTTCKNWREAYRTHVHTLRFHSYEWSGYRELSASKVENLITQTLFQTTCLQSLSILTHSEEADAFSAASVIAWLLHTKKSLRELCYNMRTNPNINIIQECSDHKLELLELAHNSISGFDLSYQKFPCLISLSLKNVTISALDLNLLLTACPKIETLKLISPVIAMSDPQNIVELSSFSLKNIYVREIEFDKFILEVDSLEELDLDDCTLGQLKFIGKGSLRVLTMNAVSILNLDFGENTLNLDVVDVSIFTSTWLQFYKLISKSSKLTKLRLSEVDLDDEGDFVDLDTMFICFPQLTHLEIDYTSVDDVCYYGLRGSYQFNNVVVLELRWTIYTDMFYFDWVAKFLAKFPSLRKLVINGYVSGAETPDEFRTFADFTSSIVRLMRKYVNVDVDFEYC